VDVCSGQGIADETVGVDDSGHMNYLPRSEARHDLLDPLPVGDRTALMSHLAGAAPDHSIGLHARLAGAVGAHLVPAIKEAPDHVAPQETVAAGHQGSLRHRLPPSMKFDSSGGGRGVVTADGQQGMAPCRRTAFRSPAQNESAIYVIIIHESSDDTSSCSSDSLREDGLILGHLICRIIR